MNIDFLCRALNLDSEVVNDVLNYDVTLNYNEIKEMCSKLLEPTTWDVGVRELQAYCGEDNNGMKILTILLHCLLDTYDKYMDQGISEKIFWDTMGFIPRFIKSHKQTYGVSAFVWAWWFPRQLSMNEFRIGEYEYEFVNENGMNKINVHIPSDARLDKGCIPAIYPFVDTYFPQYSNADIYCDSWLLAPSLNEVLPEDSRILMFQKQFSTIRIDEDSPYFMDWIYSSNNIPYEELPEKTTLQRNVKKFLQAGGKIGSAYGVFKKTEKI